MQAVPFRAKDVPAERAQFSHPDVSIILTILSYYFSGLREDQIEMAFRALSKMSDKQSEYLKWIEFFDPIDIVPVWIREY